jgi:hypothetical protein
LIIDVITSMGADEHLKGGIRKSFMFVGLAPINLNGDFNQYAAHDFTQLKALGSDDTAIVFGEVAGEVQLDSMLDDSDAQTEEFD